MHRKYFCFGLLLSLAIISCRNEPASHYDVIIVGGGIAGITAAYALNDFSVLLLEKDDRLGGRIWTKKKMDITYDMGALFGNNDFLFPSGLQKKSRIQEPDPIGFSIRGRLYLGSGVAEALSKYTSDRSVISLVDSLRKGKVSPPFETIPDSIRPVIGSFFNLIHPGKPADYMNELLRDSFRRFDTSHYKGGNAELVEAYRAEMKASVRTGADVVRVEEVQDGVMVTCVSEGKTIAASARQAIVATPATGAAAIIKTITPESLDFLRSVRYGKGYVVVLAVRKPDLPPFSYIVSPDRLLNSVFQSRTSKKDVRILTVYYTDDQCLGLLRKTKDDIIERTVSELNNMGFPAIRKNEILFSDAKLWNDLGTIVSSKPYRAFDDAMLNPSARIRLAGDYTFWNRAIRMPYGLGAAVQSGKIAAHDVRKKLAKEMRK